MSDAASMWGSAPWERVAVTMATIHDRLITSLGPGAGERWLDVATGTGAVAVRAARAGARVTALDLAPPLIETARRLAGQEGLAIDFDVGDAEALPYADASFDVVSSAHGVVFAPDQCGGRARAGARVSPGWPLGDDGLARGGGGRRARRDRRALRAAACAGTAAAILGRRSSCERAARRCVRARVQPRRVAADR